MESDAVINGVLSFFIPGLGQAIEGYKTRGILLFVIAVIIAAVFYFVHVPNNMGHAVSIIYGLIAAYYAYRLY